MKYKVLVRFWGDISYTRWLVDNVEERNQIIEELANDNAITSLKYCKVYRNGKEENRYTVIKGY